MMVRRITSAVVRGLPLLLLFVAEPARAALLARQTIGNSVVFRYPQGENTQHIIIALVLLLFGVLLPTMLRNRTRMRTLAYYVVLFAFIIATLINLHRFYAEKSFALTFSDAGVHIQELFRDTTINWNKIEELRQDNTLPIATEEPEFLYRSITRLKFLDASGMTLGMLPFDFTDADYRWIIRLCAARNITVSRKLPPQYGPEVN